MAEIDLLTVANHAEALNGMLYLAGAGWTDLRRPIGPDGRPVSSHLGIGVAVAVPWGETNRKLRLVIRIEDEDGLVLMSADGNLEVGRPPGIPQGVDQRAVLAVDANIAFPKAGGYRVVAELDSHLRTVSFRVHDIVAAG